MWQQDLTLCPSCYGNSRNKHIHKVNSRPGSSYYSVLWEEAWPGFSSGKKTEHKEDTVWAVWLVLITDDLNLLPMYQWILLYRMQGGSKQTGRAASLSSGKQPDRPQLQRARVVYEVVAYINTLKAFILTCHNRKPQVLPITLTRWQ